MSKPYYIIDSSICEQLNLWDREAMVFSALLYLCKLGPYKGSSLELAKIVRIKSDRTVRRVLDSLVIKGYIVRDEQGISLGHIVQSVGHIVQDSGHIVQNLKESTKEKYIKENKEKKGIYKENFFSPPATLQEQAHYAGSQYAKYLARKQREQQEEIIRQANDETKTVSFDDYKNSK